MRNLIFLGLAGIATYFLLQKTQLANKTKLIFKKIRFASKRFQISFAVQNPTNQTSTISAITGEVYLADRLIADFSNFAEQKIAPKSESTLNVLAQPSIGILQLISTSGWLRKGLKYTIKGTGNFDGIVLPFSFESTLG